ncbi:MAG: hypothetical protein FWH05_05660 [Oscillospiraceae bacterium]|nr:hypothetical protein [Oscillospiraceae bacterium]
MSMQSVLTVSQDSPINNTKSKAMKYLGYKIKRNSTAIIFNVIFSILSLPGLALATCILDSENSSIFAEELGQFAVMLSALGVASLIGVAFLVYLNGINMFSYYNNRVLVDVSYALPITRKERFWCDFAAGIVPNLILYVLSALTACLIFFIGAPSIMMEPDAYWRIMLEGILVGFVFLLFLYSMVVFCTSLSARVFEAAAYPFVFSVLVPSLIAIFYSLALRHPSLAYEQWFDIVMTTTTPMGFFFGAVGPVFSGEFFALKAEIIIPVVLIMGGFIAAAAALAKKRSVERVGMPFAFKIVYHVYITAIIFCVTSLFIIAGRELSNDTFLSPATFFGMVMTTAILFLVIEVITNRDFKKMKTAGIRYAVTVVGSIIIAYTLYSFDSFGIYKYLPDENNIASVEVVAGWGPSENAFTVAAILATPEEVVDWGGAYNRNELYGGIVFKEPENIKTVIRLHTNYMNSDSRGHAYRYNNSTFKYNLKDGRQIIRRVYLPNVDLEELFYSKEYREMEMLALEKVLEDTDEAYRAFSIEVEIFGKRPSYEKIFIDKEVFIETFKADFMSLENYRDIGNEIGAVRIDTQKYFADKFEKLYYRPYFQNLSYFIHDSYENTAELIRANS